MLGRMMSRFERLLEIAYAGLEDRLLLVAWNVFRDLCAGAFGVGHFAEDSAAGRCDAFDGKCRSVWIDGVMER